MSANQRHSPVIAGQVRANPLRPAKAAAKPATAAGGADSHEAGGHGAGGHGDSGTHGGGPHDSTHDESGHHGAGHADSGHHGDAHGGGHHALFHVEGLGGHIAVFDDRIEIHRHGLLHIMLELLLYYEGSTELVLPIRAITGISLVEPMMFPGYIRFYFPGSPNYSKDYWTDAMAPNTVLMPYFDHRPFHRLRDFIQARQAAM